jgi:predicted dehydrogenase
MLPGKMQENKVLRSVIIGCGNVAGGYDDVEGGTVNTHAGAYKLAPETQLIAVSDIDVSVAKLFCTKWNVNNYYSDLNEMLDKENPDIVSICTPDETHITILKQVHKWPNVQAVWCEKPLATDVEEAKEIVRIFKQTGILLAINYTRRWNKGFQAIGRMIRNGKLGKIQNAVLYYTKGICHNGSHAINLFKDWFGSLKSCQVFDGLIDFSLKDPTFNARAVFGETPVFLLGFDEREYTIFDMDILGTKGRIQITREGIKCFSVCSDSEYDGYKMLSSNDNIQNEETISAIQVALDNIVSAVKEGESLICDGEDALKTLLICDKMIKFAKGKI